jgi:hypothetical protein
MHDNEHHTVCYLRDLLVTPAPRDPDITTFLTVWSYEEMWHGQALGRVLAAHGEPSGAGRITELRRRLGARDCLARSPSWCASCSATTGGPSPSGSTAAPGRAGGRALHGWCAGRPRAGAGYAGTARSVSTAMSSVGSSSTNATASDSMRLASSGADRPLPW